MEVGDDWADSLWVSKYLKQNQVEPRITNISTKISIMKQIWEVVVTMLTESAPKSHPNDLIIAIDEWGQGRERKIGRQRRRGWEVEKGKWIADKVTWVLALYKDRLSK